MVKKSQYAEKSPQLNSQPALANQVGNATSHQQLGQIPEQSGENTELMPEQKSRALKRRSQTIEIDSKPNSGKNIQKNLSPSSSKRSKLGHHQEGE